MQEAGNYGDYVHFNHRTFLNVVMFALESGWWYRMSVTNSIWINGFMIGCNPAAFGAREPFGGTIRIDSVANFGFDVPFTDQNRRILFANNSYFIEPWLRTWVDNNPYSIWRSENGKSDCVPVPQAMLSQGTMTLLESSNFPFMNMANWYDAADPDFILAPSHIAALKQFRYCKWNTGLDTNWACLPEAAAMRLWPLKENLAHTNDILLTAGIASFPLGDLYHWFPNEYQRWQVRESAEYTRILHWLDNSRDSIFTDLHWHHGD